MRLKVFGQLGNGPVIVRVVTVAEFVSAWGEWAQAVAAATRANPLVVGVRRVWTEVLE